MRRPRAAALLVGLVALVAACSAPAAAPTDASHLAQARAAAVRMLADLRLPPGSVRLSHTPVPALSVPDGFVSPDDASVHRTAWWHVPVGLSAFTTWLTDVHEPGLTRSGDVSAGASRRGGKGPTIYQTSLSAPGTASYTERWLVLEYVGTTSGVDVRADTFFAARFARVPDSYARSVSSIDIALVPELTMTPPAQQQAPMPTVHLTRTSTVEALVRAFDRLPGASTVGVAISCPAPPPGAAYSDRITFHTTSGDLVAHLRPQCVATLTAWRDGRQAGHPIDPRDFGDVVARAYDAAATSLPRLVGTWDVVGVTGPGGRTLTPPGHPFLTFHADGTFRGSDAVNAFGGHVTSASGRLRLSHVSSTLVGLTSSAPRPLTATVHAFAVLLSGSPASAHVDGTTLTLLLGRSTLTLRKR